MTGTVRAALAAGAARLAAAGVPEAARDARRLMAAALGVAPDRLTLLAGDPLPAGADATFGRMIAERGRFRPVSQITGRRSFWGRDFAVTGAVLDPRPETETLVALALAGRPAACILDLGVGSGAILLTLLAEWPNAQGTGVDIDPAALALARKNAQALGVAGRARFREADWTDGIAERFDLVVANPPYVAEAELDALAPDVRDWEPRHALTAGPSGLESYARLAPAIPAVLAPGGRVLVEVGAGQGAAVAARFAEAGFRRVEVHPDLDGRDRVVEAADPG
ncbi:MAG: peptide chain release factor N(5)-glutamine methyltransferase [Amaricoccus sp.]